MTHANDLILIEESYAEQSEISLKSKTKYMELVGYELEEGD